MSDSDSDEELKQLIAECANKDQAENVPSPDEPSKKKPIKEKKISMKVPMDKVLFGDRTEFMKQLAKTVNEEDTKEKLESIDGSDSVKKRKPVWTDEDDNLELGDIQNSKIPDYLRKSKKYKEVLTTRFTRIMPQPKWAKLDEKVKVEPNSDDEELLQTVGFLSKPALSTLPAQQLQIKRLKDLNRATYAEGKINSIQFHPTSTCALVAGNSGTATIYSIDGLQNEKLHSMHFRNFPIACARIKPCGTKAIFGSVKNFYYSYDLLTAQEIRHFLPKSIATTMHKFRISPCGRYIAAAGRFGYLHLFDAVTQELIHTFKQEDDVAGLCFTANSERLVSNSKSCNVSIFSLRQQRIEHTFIDEGCISGRVLDLSPSQRLLATGSNEGVVNVYDFDKVYTQTPLPVKTFLNLRTGISDIKFNHTSELLAMTAYEVPSAIKLAHFFSGTVFANFPDFKAELGKIKTVEFSPASGYLAVGNCAKAVPLFRLKHFKNY